MLEYILGALVIIGLALWLIKKPLNTAFLIVLPTGSILIMLPRTFHDGAKNTRAKRKVLLWRPGRTA